MAGGTAAAGPDTLRDRTDWDVFCGRCLTAEGRVVDTANRGVSHSEGQGAALLFAARAGDRARFDRILAWTRGTLGRPGDFLHAWRYRPGAALPVDDPNNATDGDLLIAWALALAHGRWGEASHRRLAVAIAGDVLRLCTLGQGGRRLLLPAAFGFQHPGRVVVNLSYYLHGAFEALAALRPDPAWAALQDGGLALLREARFGRWGLPPDWLQVPRGAGSPAPAADWPPRFSWDAVRIPLHLVWSDHGNEPAVAAAAAFWSAAPAAVPAWVDLVGGQVAPMPAPPGVQAVARLTLAAVAGAPPGAALPVVAEARDYDGAALVMMARMAWTDRIALPAAQAPG